MLIDHSNIQGLRDLNSERRISINTYNQQNAKAR